MTYGDINSGAVPQPGGIVKAAAGDEAATGPEQVAKATEDALNGEGAFANVEAGIKGDNDPAQTVPVVEADDQEASGQSDEEDKDLGYVAVTEHDDQVASGNDPSGDGNSRLPTADEAGLGDDSEDDEGDDSEDDEDTEEKGPEDEEEAGPPAKSALKEEWVDYAVSKGADREEAEAKTVKELQDEYGE